MQPLFTSDTHFGHANIIKFCNRPFTSAEAMDEELIRRWNTKVQPHQVVYHLGDIFFKMPVERAIEIRNRLNGHIVRLRGNHDQIADRMPERCWLSVHDIKEVTVTVGEESKSIVLCHYPMASWNKSFHGSWHLFGHVHGGFAGYGRSFDVGVDCTNFYPLTVEEVAQRMTEIEKTRKVGQV